MPALLGSSPLGVLQPHKLPQSPTTISRTKKQKSAHPPACAPSKIPRLPSPLHKHSRHLPNLPARLGIRNFVQPHQHIPSNLIPARRPKSFQPLRNPRQTNHQLIRHRRRFHLYLRLPRQRQQNSRKNQQPASRYHQPKTTQRYLDIPNHQPPPHHLSSKPIHAFLKMDAPPSLAVSTLFPVIRPPPFPYKILVAQAHLPVFQEFM